MISCDNRQYYFSAVNTLIKMRRLMMFVLVTVKKSKMSRIGINQISTEILRGIRQRYVPFICSSDAPTYRTGIELGFLSIHPIVLLQYFLISRRQREFVLCNKLHLLTTNVAMDTIQNKRSGIYVYNIYSWII